MFVFDKIYRKSAPAKTTHVQLKLYEDAKKRQQRQEAEKEKANKQYDSLRSQSRMKSSNKEVIDRLWAPSFTRRGSNEDPSTPKQFSFKPNINEKSKVLADKARSKSRIADEDGDINANKNSEHIYNRRLKEQRFKNTLAQSTKEMKELKELEEWSFKPEINKKSKICKKKSIDDADKVFKRYMVDMKKSKVSSPTKSRKAGKNGNDMIKKSLEQYNKGTKIHQKLYHAIVTLYRA